MQPAKVERSTYMKQFVKRAFSGILALMAVLMMLPATALASESKDATPIGENVGWVRAKLTYQYDDGITGLNDSAITFVEGWSKKSDGWYYYNRDVSPGDRIRFISNVKIPTSWDNSVSNKKFRVIVTAELAEVAPKDEGWDANTPIAYSKSFDLWSMGYEHDEDVWIEEGKTWIMINEYQLDKDGNEVPYVNDKIITSGQLISKIVEFEIGGKKGANVKLVPEKPVKTVTVAGVDVDGKNVNGGTILTYGITVKNPAPDRREITITDVVDNRLTVTKINDGGHFIENPADEMGGTIEWKVWVDGKESATVTFLAKAPEGSFEEKGGLVIPNTAEATIVGKKLKSNTVIVGLGNPSALKKAIARATGDPARFALAIAVVVALSAGAIAVMLLIMKRRERAEADDDNTDKEV